MNGLLVLKKYKNSIVVLYVCSLLDLAIAVISYNCSSQKSCMCPKVVNYYDMVD